MPLHNALDLTLSRRTLLTASLAGVAGCGTGSCARAAEDAVNPPGGARSTILFFLCGGASHIDLWDLKPEAPLEYRGPFQPIATSSPDVALCEHLPLLAQQAHHLTVINSVGASVNTNDHHAGYYYNLTGHVPDVTFRTLGNNRTPQPDDWPFMGSVVAAKRGSQSDLPSAISLPHSPSRKPYTRPGQFAARLGVEHDPLYLNASRSQPLQFHAPALSLEGRVSYDRLTQRSELLRALDSARASFDQSHAARLWGRHSERALSLLLSSSTTKAFDLTEESPARLERYGRSVNAMSLLLARRLVEAGVPFITVFWLGEGIGSPLAKKCKSAGSWDTHGNNFGCLKDSLLPEFDRCFSALIEDLHDRGLMDSTLLMVTSEMGRKPRIGDPRSGGKSGAGRDHWTHCLTDILAGGGLQTGFHYGSSDRLGEYPADLPVTPADVARTVYRAMGINDLEAIDAQGRPYQLLADGEPIRDLF